MKKVAKRKDYITWDECFMGVALLVARRSKDPHSQVGCCIVDDNHKVLSTGYNGAPTGFDDDKISWAREGDFLDTKYPYVCHSEMNAILNAHGQDLRGGTLYTVLFPCNECAKAIIQAGIKKVIYLEHKYPESDSYATSPKMMDACGVVYEKYQPVGRKLELNL